MGPKLRARFENRANLNPEELEQLRADLIAAFDLLDDNGGNVDELNEIADAIDSVRVEEANRVERNSLRDRVHASAESTEDTGESSGEEGEAEEGEEETEEDSTEEGAVEDSEGTSEEPIAAAARPPLSAMKKAAPKSRAPASTTHRVTTRLVAAGDVAGFSAGQEIGTRYDLALALTRKLQSLGRNGPSDNVLVASVYKDYPEERQLGEDALVNDAKIEAVVGPQALVAAGGICQPLAVDYAIDVIGSTARPLQASLPSFNATRGGVKYTPAPVLSGVTPPETWTNADQVGGTATKTCFTVACGTPVEAMVYGIPVCIEVDNLMGRFSPEMINAQSSLLDVATARMAELELINAIDAGSIAVTSTGILGTIRTILPTLDLLAAGYRYRNRLDSTGRIRAVLPDWVRDEVKADISMELAHDDGESLGVTDAQVNSYLSNRGITPVWTLEDKANSFGAAQAPGAINAWPNTFVAYFYAEGTWQFLDGGRIDLGVVRDSTLNSKNKYQIWREDFEGIAKRGAESLKVTVTAKPTGMSAGTKDTSA